MGRNIFISVELYWKFHPNIGNFWNKLTWGMRCIENFWWVPKREIPARFELMDSLRISWNLHEKTLDLCNVGDFCELHHGIYHHEKPRCGANPRKTGSLLCFLQRVWFFWISVYRLVTWDFLADSYKGWWDYRKCWDWPSRYCWPSKWMLAYLGTWNYPPATMKSSPPGLFHF